MTHSTATAEAPRLAHLPVTFFASVMGLAGYSLALHVGGLRLGLGAGASVAMLWAAIAAFLAIAAFYTLKALRHPQAVAAEWHHPVKLAFFPAISISLLLIATAMRLHAEGPARVIWMIGATGQAALTLAVISGWIGHRPFQHLHVSPAWFIPAVGNVVAPVAGVPLGFVELSWMFFAVGAMFWIVLLTLVMNRLIFHDPLPGKLLPTLVILIAPPAVAFLAWLSLNGGVLDPFARILFYVAVMFAALVAVQAAQSFRGLPFALSWWALSFPLAALTIATYRYAALAGTQAHAIAAPLLLAVLSVVIVALVIRTGLAIARGEICRPE